MLLLARTTPTRSGRKPHRRPVGVLSSICGSAVGNGLTIRPIRTMMNHATTELFFDNLRDTGLELIGEEGKGFRYILDGMNAERILIAAECIGDARWFLDKARPMRGTVSFSASRSARTRVFNSPWRGPSPI